MATISGKWLFNEVLISDGWSANNIAETVNFSFTTGKAINDYLVGDVVSCTGFKSHRNSSTYYPQIGLSFLLSPETAPTAYWWNFEGTLNYWTSWCPDRTVDFGKTEQTVTQEFYDWFIRNANLIDTPSDIKPIYKRVSGEWVKQNAYERQDGEWVKISNLV